MKANKSQKALYRPPTFSLPASHSRLVHVHVAAKYTIKHMNNALSASKEKRVYELLILWHAKTMLCQHTSETMLDLPCCHTFILRLRLAWL